MSLLDFFNDPPKTTIESEVKPLQVTQEQHKHEWELVSKTQAPPRRDISVETLKTFSQADSQILQQMLFGVTELMWECMICHDHKKAFTLGSDISQLDELIDKADRFGPQYIQRTDGTTFILTKYQQSPSALPLR